MLYPEPKGEPLEANGTLQEALESAIAASPNAQVQMEAAFAIVALRPEGPHPFAEWRGTEMHYSASVLKLAGAYAALELGRAGRELTEERQATAADAVPMLHDFDPEIRATKLSQLAPNLEDKYLLPNYERMSQFDPELGKLVFTGAFMDSLSASIAKASNQDAANCVHGVGFGYLTRVMVEAGFLDSAALESPSSADGIWLGGDFGFGYPAQRIPSVNDGAVAQATSARQMARLLTLLQRDELIVRTSHVGAPPKANETLRDILAQAVGNGNHLLTKGTGVSGYVTKQSAMGYGALKTGALVASEALVVADNAGREFVVVFQNVPYNETPASLAPTAGIIERVITSFAG